MIRNTLLALIGATAVMAQSPTPAACPDAIGGLNGHLISYTGPVDGQTYDFKVNFCADAPPCIAGVAVCQSNPSFNYGLGNTAGVTASRSADGNTVTVNYIASPNSNVDSIPRSSKIVVTCKADATTDTVTSVTEDMFSYAYTFNIDSPLACPGAGPSGGGGGLSFAGIALIIFFVLILVYFAGGFVFMKFVKKTEGLVESVPNISFWQDLPGLIKDGAMFIGSKTCCRGSAGSSASGYDQV